MASDLMQQINELSAERQELFRLAAEGKLPRAERGRMQELSSEIARLWDAYRREGHPPAVPPVKDEWEQPRRGRKPAASREVEHSIAWPENKGIAA